MYVAVVVLLTVVLPVGSAVGEHLVVRPSSGWLMLLGAWMTFWAGGVRLFLAGLRQTFQPRFTSEQIFGNSGTEALPIVQELGLANLAMGALGILTAFDRQMVLPAAIVAGLFHGLAGIRHAWHGERNSRRTTAMLTDLWVFLVLAAYVGGAVSSLP